MRLLPSDPDIATIVSRIRNDDLDLQPDFQRGEVWSDVKKQRLIDSILREWHVPPIHVIEVKETGKQEVLDGQQRLAAIRDFVDGVIRVDGHTEPLASDIAKLHGMRYRDLPQEWRRRFDQFTIRVFRITDYEPGEPYELFYRLNQPANLTAAEQRNAFFGPARAQVKELVDRLEDVGINKDLIGFSNSRMAYDDVVARLCLSLEVGGLGHKVTAGGLTSRYRSQEPFKEEIILRTQAAIHLFGLSIPKTQAPLRLNKATLYSWLWFVSDARTMGDKFDSSALGDFLSFFESIRLNPRANSESESGTSRQVLGKVTVVYNDRSSARVADVSSVLARDAVIWVGLSTFRRVEETSIPADGGKLPLLNKRLSTWNAPADFSADMLVEAIISDPDWGRPL